MPKTRFTAIDVAGMVTDLQPHVGLRLANIYDVNAKTLLLKLASPELKTLLLVESGIRVHPTKYAREKSATPSHFVAKLRKHVKSRRLARVRQLGADRIIQFIFGENEFAYHLFVELYSSGNIILTTHEFVILAVLRVVDVETSALSAASAPAPAPSVASETLVQLTVTTTETVQSNAAAPQPQPDATKVDLNFRVGQRYTMVDFEKPFVAPHARDIVMNAFEEYRRAAITPAVAADLEPVSTEQSTSVVPDELAIAPSDASGKKGGKGGGKKAAATQKKKEKKQQQAAAASKDNGLSLRKWAKEKFGFLYGPALVDHGLFFVDSTLDPSAIKMRDLVDDADSQKSVLNALISGLEDANRVMEDVMVKGVPCKGWITQAEHKQPMTTTPFTDPPKESLITYEEFYPYHFSHLSRKTPGPAGPPLLHYPTFATCVDEFFTHTETQRLQLRLHQAETASASKLAGVARNHTAQVERLQGTCVQSARVAAAIEARLELVEAVLSTVRAFVRAGMDWGELWELVREEKRAGNPVAGVIEGLKLDVGVVTVILLDADFEEEEEDEEESEDGDESEESSDEDGNAITLAAKKATAGKRKAEAATRQREAEERRRKAMHKIDLDIYLSAYANARRYYDSKKLAAVKAEKTITAVSKAMKQAEKKINQELKATKNAAPVIRTLRTPYWFEKFMWFITSENYLVVAGRDAMQTELIMRKYMKKDDVCVSADIDGAPLVLVINSFSASLSTNAAATAGADARPPGLTPHAPIPPLSLHQAGTMCVVHSRAWEAKIVTSAWWVKGEVVMRHGGIAPVSKAEKHYLPPVQLIYGFALLFVVDEASAAARHFDERRPWARGAAGALEQDGTALEDVADSEVGEGGTAGDEDSEVDVDDGKGFEERSGEKLNETSAEEVVVDFDKYDLAKPEVEEELDEDIEGVAVVDENDGGSPDGAERPVSAGPSGKKRLSAKGRRDLKKKAGAADAVTTVKDEFDDASEPGGEGPVEEEEKEEEYDDEPVSVPTKSKSSKGSSVASVLSKNSSATTAAPTKPMPRGKKSKLKKVKDKYADQSEDEKEVMMELLHGSEAKKKKEADMETLASKSGKNPGAKSFPHGGKGGQQEQKGGKSNAPPKAKSTGLAGKIEFHGDAEDIDLSFLSLFTSQPQMEDTLQFCVPVCAPWTCLGKYKYKIKLLPGSLKKGKAAKSAESTFKAMATKSDDKREVDVIGQLLEAEFTAAMLSKVKVMGGAAGGDAKGGKKK